MWCRKKLLCTKGSDGERVWRGERGARGLQWQPVRPKSRRAGARASRVASHQLTETPPAAMTGENWPIARQRRTKHHILLVLCSARRGRAVANGARVARGACRALAEWLARIVTQAPLVLTLGDGAGPITETKCNTIPQPHQCRPTAGPGGRKPEGAAGSEVSTTGCPDSAHLPVMPPPHT